jgi:hypothetical protein
MKKRDEFKSLTLKLLSAVVKGHYRDNRYFKTVHKTESDRTVSFSNEIGPAYAQGIRTLRLKAQSQKKFLSDEKLESLFDDYIVELAYCNQTNLNNEIDRQITLLFSTVTHLPNERRVYLIPLVNISLLTSGMVIIGDSEILKISPTFFADFQKEYDLQGQLFQNSETAFSTLSKNNATSVFIKIFVDATDSERALETSLERAEMVLNVLRLYAPDAPVRLRGDELACVTRDVVSGNLEKKAFSEKSSSENLVANAFIIDDQVIEEMMKHSLQTISLMLTKEKSLLTELEKNILTSIFWFGAATKDRYRVSSFLKYVIAVETLLLKGEKNKKETISERLTSILYGGAVQEDKAKACFEMWRLYQIRNDIIHAGKDYVERDEVVQIEYWCRALILKLLNYTATYADILDFLRKEASAKKP